MSRQQVQDLLDVLDESDQNVTTIAIEGRLASADRIRKRFSIESDDGELIAGAIVEEAWEQVARIDRPFTPRCRVTLERTVSTSKGGEQSATTYRLQEIQPIEG
jgi:hypothetical protein